MDIIKITIAVLVGTTLMTAFSYIVSAAFSKLFKEPALLNYVLQLLGADLKEHLKSAAGWVLHFLFGLLFVLAYEIVWENTSLKPTWICAAIFGAISGIIGILGWMIIFRIPDKKPRVHFKEYYLQLFFAHIVFALGVVAVYQLWE